MLEYIFGVLVVGLIIIFVVNSKRTHKNNNNGGGPSKGTFNEVGIVEKLFVYPIKSCGGIELKSAVIGKCGFKYDRQWVVAKADEEIKSFVTQRQYPKMALINTRFDENHLIIDANGMDTLKVPLEGNNHNGKEENVRIWNDVTLGIDEGDQIADWFTRFLKPETSLRLMRISGVRKMMDIHQKEDADNEVTFVDKHPFLLINQKSLESLNEMVKSIDLTLARFRPNIFISTQEPWEEDKWKDIRIEDTDFHIIDGCQRCKIPTVDPTTGEFDLNNEPLQTINSRPHNPKVFGQTMIHPKKFIGKEIRVGMKIYSLSKLKQE